MAQTVTRAAGTNKVQPFEKQHRRLAYEAAVESIVLLENKGVLPLAPGPVALFGAGAEKTVKGGTGSGEVNGRRVLSIREGLEQLEFSVTTEGWLKGYRQRYEEEKEAYIRRFRSRLKRLAVTELINIMREPFCAPVGQPISEADLQAAQTDTCIYVVARQAGEGSDRQLDRYDYSLTPEEKTQIRSCAEAFARFVLVLNVGGPFDLRFLDEIPGIGAVVFFAQQGAMGAQALADLLCGRQTPSGKLADTWADSYDDLPFAREYSYLNGDPEEEYYREDIYVGYRYFDSFDAAPRYPFGYGLSYTTFERKFLEIRADASVQVRVQVTNTGSYPGKETVQLYARCPQSEDLPKERQRLVAFGKTGLLLPGQQEVLMLTFGPEALASYWEAEDATVVEQGDHVLFLGTSSRDSQPVAAVRVEKRRTLARHKRLCGPKQLSELLRCALSDESRELPTVLLPETETVVHSYEEPAPRALSAKLSKKEQAQLCVGGGMFRFRHYDAPGAAGVTTGKLLQKGIPQAVLADGPAGVRLAQRSVRLKNGQIKPVEPPMEVMGYLPEFVKGFLCGDPRKGEVLYQFTTAFPVELALAQTWNTALLERIGQAVGREMAHYGVSYWLAPALNIHRNPLCGRNFEYYSEDPLLSGLMAAAVTRGVQSVPGRFVTLKHFACNNQETARNTTNANVSVRALREIYLRGFEIAVRQGKPEAVMTSYNKLNGTYTPNSHDLLTKLLRCEWGFEGLVMTDWMSTGGKLADVAACIAAGNDLIMPGNDADVTAILLGLRSGRITDVQLCRCAANVLHSLSKTK